MYLPRSCYPRAGPTGLEPATSGVTVRHSNRLSYGPLLRGFTFTPQLAPAAHRAGNRARTGDLNLGKVALYQLSYARIILPDPRSHGESNPALNLERVVS